MMALQIYHSVNEIICCLLEIIASVLQILKWSHFIIVCCRRCVWRSNPPV